MSGVGSAIGAPLLTARDPKQMRPTARLRPPSAERPFGADHFGRDVFARTLYGASVLLALALMALVKASVETVITALVIPEVPRILVRYILPALVAPLIVQGTHACASAILVESYLSFLGAGTSPHIPSWGSVMAEGRAYVQIGFWILLFSGLFLMLTVLSINLFGDGLRDRLKV